MKVIFKAVVFLVVYNWARGFYDINIIIVHTYTDNTVFLPSYIYGACKFVDVTTQQKKIIFQSKQSFLYFGSKPWVKKGDQNFDIGMGAYDGSQACELVGLFMLDKMKDIKNFKSGVYRDDCLGVTTSSPRLQEKIKQEIIRIFAANGLSLTIDINLRSVQFLDVCLDLETGIYKPFMKPGDMPKYVNAQSNHPPMILRNLPLGINRRRILYFC